MKKKHQFETMCVHGSGETDPSFHSVAPPLYQTATFTFESADEGADLFQNKKEGYYYTRMGNPTINALCRQVAVLEGCDAALAFGSGMACEASVMMAMVPSGGKILSSHTLYGGTHCLFTKTLPKWGIETVIVEDDAPETYRRHLDSDEFSLVFIETPSNPTLSIVDIRAVAAAAAEKNIPLAVDNTFATSCFQKPAELGADLVLHSATKYIGGHGDVIAGIAAGRQELIEKIRLDVLHKIGPIIGPFEAWLLLRGLKTLSVRMERHGYNAMRVARFLERHPAVSRVHYPGLPSHPGHDLACRQMSGFGGVVSFEVADRDEGRQVMNGVSLFKRAVSIGECDSLIQHPASITHSGLSECELEASGINPGLIRLSIGLENADDLIADLRNALDTL